MKGDRLGAFGAGLGLIGLGIALLVATVAGWDRIWPIFPLFGGLAFLIGYAAGGFRDGGLAFVGTAATLIGLFFFGFTLGVWEWGDMAWLWPVFPFIGGLAFVVLFFAERRARDWGVLGVGLAALIVGAVGLAITAGGVEEDVWRYWPVLLIFLGVVSLISGLFARPRKL